VLEYILFKCRERIDSKNYKYLPVLKRSLEEDTMYNYYVIDDYYIHLKKRITKNTIRYLTELSLISYIGYFISDTLFLDFYQDCYFYDIVFKYTI